MSLESSTGQMPRTTASVSPKEKTAVSEYRLRCPDCGFTKDFSDHAEAAAHQRRFPCPHCDRMLGLSERSRDGSADDLEAAEAVAAAEEERARLARDGPAPSTSEILRVMGRDADGYPLSQHATHRTAHDAAQLIVHGTVSPEGSQ